MMRVVAVLVSFLMFESICAGRSMAADVPAARFCAVALRSFSVDPAMPGTAYLHLDVETPDTYAGKITFFGIDNKVYEAKFDQLRFAPGADIAVGFPNGTAASYASMDTATREGRVVTTVLRSSSRCAAAPPFAVLP
ncbi:MAG: hypothetical protein DLM50_00795 [Candidatus Meridianibacter frigidus]|nr:MAG: hypothetical protein DLM50_00795 [Candidatus Eremiobacteraeota bacterium]